jgi:outer membrane protein assembly factor BamB
VELPGNGYGSPVVWGTKLFVNCANDDGTRRIVQCRDTRTGELIWSQEFASETHKHHKNNSFASSTPACDEQHVYVSWGTPEKLTLMALDHDGNVVWDAPGLGGVKGGHGHGASPMVYGDLVVLNNDQDGDSSLLAVDRATGTLKWDIPRNSVRLTYSTPVVYENPAGNTELIFVNWIHGITAVDPASGTVNWEVACFPHDAKERAIGGPVLYDDLVIATCAFVNSPKHLVAVRPSSVSATQSSQAAVSGAEEIWRVDNTTVPHIPTTLVYEDRLYTWNDQGIVTCYVAATGEKVWQKRIGGAVFGSPVCVGSRLYSITNDGEVICVATGDEFRELGRSDLGEKCQSTPAIAGGTMFIRTAGHLLSVGGTSE